MMINEKLNMRWKCEARTDHLDQEIAELMKEAGCIRVKLGFESGSDRILKQIKKLETKDEMLDGVSYLKKAVLSSLDTSWLVFPEKLIKIFRKL